MSARTSGNLPHLRPYSRHRLKSQPVRPKLDASQARSLKKMPSVLRPCPPMPMAGCAPHDRCSTRCGTPRQHWPLTAAGVPQSNFRHWWKSCGLGQQLHTVGENLFGGVSEILRTPLSRRSRKTLTQENFPAFQEISCDDPSVRQTSPPAGPVRETDGSCGSAEKSADVRLAYLSKLSHPPMVGGTRGSPTGKAGLKRQVNGYEKHCNREISGYTYSHGNKQNTHYEATRTPGACRWE